MTNLFRIGPWWPTQAIQRALSAMCRIATVMTLTYGSVWGAESRVASEYQVKAAFLYNFAKFIDWPPKAFTTSSNAFTFCILGADPFGMELDRTIKNETVGGREIVIRRLRRVQDRDTCQILFISASEKDSLGQIFTVLRNASVLTVGDFDSFTHSGGMINLYIEDDRVRFEINIAPAENAGLRISSKLLKLAKITR